MLDYYLKMEPHLFTTAIDKQLERLKEEREEKDRLAKESPPSSEDKSELVLYRYVCNWPTWHLCVLQLTGAAQALQEKQIRMFHCLQAHV